MTQQEAANLVEQWIREHSLLAAHVVSSVQDTEGAWRIQAECSEAIWWQKVTNKGEVCAPELID